MRDALIAHLRGQGFECHGVKDLQVLLAEIVDRPPSALILEAWPGADTLDQLVAIVRALCTDGLLVVVGTQFTAEQTAQLRAAGADLVTNHFDFPIVVVPALSRPTHDRPTYPMLPRIRAPN
jgi:DNA-binding response OmpR family regulator